MSSVPPLSYQTPIVDPTNGKPSNFFLRLWQSIFFTQNIRVTADRTVIKYNGVGVATPSDQTTTFTASKSNATSVPSWTMKDSSGNTLIPNLYLSNITGDEVTMTRAQFEAAIAVNTTIGVRITASIVYEGETFRDQATITRVQDGVDGDGSPGADGEDGFSIAEIFCFQRSGSGTPSTPSGGSYDFTTKVLTPPSGWFVVPPSGTDPLYMAKGTVFVTGLSGTATPSWAGVGKIAQDGAAGSDGIPALTVEISNPAIPLWAYANGDVLSYTPATGFIKVAVGATDVSSNFSLSVVTNPQSLSVGFTGLTYAVTGGFDPSEDNATLTIRVSGSGAYTGIFFDKTIVLSKMKGGYEIVGSLPASNLFEGRVVYLTTDNKLYRYDGSSWITSVPVTDLSGQIQTTQIADNSVSTPKLQANAITANELASNSVTTNKIAAGQVTAAKIAVTQLDAISATIGTLRTATTGARMEIRDNVLKVFDSSGSLRVQVGDLSL